MTQLGRVPADVAKTDSSQTWSGTQDFTAATVLGIAGGSGGTTVSGATATTAGVVQLAGDLAGPYTAPTVVRLNGATPAAVATSGAYADLTGKPALATVATTGAYTDLTGKPALATVATTGAYTDLTGRPALAAVATTGAYADLTGKPAAYVAPLYAALSADGAAGSVNTDTAVVSVAAVPVGTYALDAFTVTGSTNAVFAKLTNPTDASGTVLVLGVTGSAGTGETAVTVGSGTHTTVASALGFRWGGIFTVTTPTTLTLMHWNSSLALTPKAGSYMLLTRLA